MKRVLSFTLSLLLTVLTVGAMVPAIGSHIPFADALFGSHRDGFIMAMFLPAFRLISKPVESLIVASRPSSGLPEVVPWYFYDRQSFTTASTTLLNFFAASQADPSLSNMELVGQLPTPQFLEVYAFPVDILIARSVLAGHTVQGALNDQEILRRSGRGRWTFTMAGKNYGPFPLTAFGPPGNLTGFGWATLTAESQQEYSGWAACFASHDPIITLPPTTGFKVVLQWPAVVTVAGSPVNIECGLWGALHRKVA